MLGLLMYEVFEAERGLFLSLSGLILGSPKWSSLFHHFLWFVLRFRVFSNFSINEDFIKLFASHQGDTII
jgi:hypothetical protein